jgi:hypothetical protein
VLITQGRNYAGRLPRSCATSLCGRRGQHIHLFKRFREEFEAGFGSSDSHRPASGNQPSVLSHHPLAVALTIAHIEWMTQRHYTDSVG